MTAPVPALRRKTMSTWSMVVVAGAASALLVVLVGSIPATYATTGVVALPLLFLLVGAVVALLSVGYTAMARRVKHAAVYYASIAHGLGRPMGVAAGGVGLLAYNAILTAQFGLFGFTASDLFGGPWWVWALVAAAVIAFFGVRGIATSTVFLAVILGLELLVLTLFNLTALGHPAESSLSGTGFTVAALAGGLGGAGAYVVASLFGFELGGSFVEESTTSRAASRAVFIALGALTVAYAVTAYATGEAAGPGQVATAAADPAGLPYTVLENQFGPLMVSMTRLLLLFAIITSMLAFHTVAARYAFAMARDGVLHRKLKHTGSGIRSESPVGGSWLQTGVSVIVILLFTVTDADPMATLFAWFSAAAALGLLALLILTSLAAILYLPRRGADAESLWTRLIAPTFGLVGGAVLFYEMLFNLGAMIGAGPGSATMRWLIPVIVFAVGAVGLLWAGYLRAGRREVYERIGRGQPDEYAVVDRQLADYSF
jgi:amino acid transporter